MTAGLLALGGCGRSTTTDSPTRTERGADGEIRDPSTRTVRHPDGRAPVRSTTETPSEIHPWRDTRWLASTAAERDALVYAQGATGVEAAMAFVAAMDGSVLIHQYPIEPCRTRRLNRVTWRVPVEGPGRAAEIGVEYTVRDRTERDDCVNDEDDSSSENDVAATLVRVPIDADLIVSFSSLVD